jgi:hypothetical protein
MSATFRAGAQLLRHPVEGGDPLRDEVAATAGPEELFGAAEQLGIVLVPAESAPAAQRLGDPVAVAVDGRDDVVAADQVDGAVLVGEDERLLGREGERAAAGVVVDIAARRLGRQPLVHVQDRHAGALGDLRRCQRSGVLERRPQAELRTQRGTHAGTARHRQRT